MHKAECLFVGWPDQPGTRNLLRFIFLEAAARSRICVWEERARRVAAEFRATCSPHLHEPAFANSSRNPRAGARNSLDSGTNRESPDAKAASARSSIRLMLCLPTSRSRSILPTTPISN
jgi:hypothetical protein